MTTLVPDEAAWVGISWETEGKRQEVLCHEGNQEGSTGQ